MLSVAFLFCYVSWNISLIISIRTGHVSAINSLAHEVKDSLRIGCKLMAAIRQASGIARQEESLKREISSLFEYEDDRYLYVILDITILRIIFYIYKWKNVKYILLWYVFSSVALSSISRRPNYGHQLSNNYSVKEGSVVDGNVYKFIL